MMRKIEVKNLQQQQQQPNQPSRPPPPVTLPQTSSPAKTAFPSATKSYLGFTPSFVAERQPANEASTNLPTAAAEREQAQTASPNMPTATREPFNHVAERESTNSVSSNSPTAALDTTTTDTEASNISTVMQPDTQEPPGNATTRGSDVSINEKVHSNWSRFSHKVREHTTTTDTEARSTSTMRPDNQEPPANPATHGIDIAKNDQVHSSWSRFSRKVRDIITGTELHDEAKKVRKEHEKAQKQHEKLQAQRAESLKQLARLGWNVKDVHGTEKGN